MGAIPCCMGKAVGSVCTCDPPQRPSWKRVEEDKARAKAKGVAEERARVLAIVDAEIGRHEGRGSVGGNMTALALQVVRDQIKP